MVDFATTASRVYGMLIKPEATLAYNSRPVPPWRIVAMEHVLPVIAVSVAVHGFLLWAFQPVYEAAYNAAGRDVPGPGAMVAGTLLRIVIQFTGLVVWAAVVGFFAGALGGRNDFNAAYVLVALALTPYLISAAFVPIPGIGMLLWIAGFFYAMVILYRGAPALVGVPSENRVKHLVLSLVSMLLAGVVAALLIGPLVAGAGSTAG